MRLTPYELKKSIATRLLAAWVVLSIVLGIGSYYFESKQIDAFVFSLAAQAAKHFNNPENEAAFLGNLNQHRSVVERFLKDSRFAGIRLFGSNKKLELETGSRQSAFDSLDMPALKPLVSQPYQFREFLKVRAGFDYHVEIDQHFYSVPHALVRKQLEAILTASTIEILHGGKRVTSWARSYEAGKKSTDTLHMESAHRHFAQWDSEHELRWALSVGVSTHAFLQVVFSKAPHRDFSYRWANSIKSLSREYGHERLEAACKRALEIGATATMNVRSILKNNLDQNANKLATAEEAAFDHDNIRGADYYH